MQEGDICPKCGEGILHKPKVFYSVFDGKRQPDFVCDRGDFCWERPDPVAPHPVLKPAEQKERKEPTFKELLEIEARKKEKRKEKRRRNRQNRRRRRALEAEKSRT